MKDMHKSIKVISLIAPQAIGTTGIAGGKLSAALDRRGYESVEFIFNAGLAATVADTVVPVVYECDTSGGTFTSVADADLIGDETAIARTTAAGVSKSIGYRGNKRYLKLRTYGVGGATGLVAAVAVMGNPNLAPVAT